MKYEKTIGNQTIGDIMPIEIIQKLEQHELSTYKQDKNKTKQQKLEVN